MNYMVIGQSCSVTATMPGPFYRGCLPQQGYFIVEECGSVIRTATPIGRFRSIWTKSWFLWGFPPYLCLICIPKTFSWDLSQGFVSQNLHFRGSCPICLVCHFSLCNLVQNDIHKCILTKQLISPRDLEPTKISPRWYFSFYSIRLPEWDSFRGTKTHI